MNLIELFNAVEKVVSLSERKKQNVRKANRGLLRQQKTLFEEMPAEKKKRSVKVCDAPKTYKFIPIDATEEEEKQYIAMHYDSDGKFIMQPAGDYNVFGGQVNRG